MLFSSCLQAFATDDLFDTQWQDDLYEDDMDGEIDWLQDIAVLADSEAVWLLGGTVADEGSFAEMWQKAVTAGNGVVQLQKDVVADSSFGFGSGTGFYSGGLYVPENCYVGLDLNGHALDRNLVNGGSNKRIISLLSETAQLDIYDTAGGGRLTGLDTSGSVILCNGLINLYGGSIRENVVGQSAVWVGVTGQFNLYEDGPDYVDSEVVNNTAKLGAKTAGIYVQGILGVGGNARVEYNKDIYGNDSNVVIACDSENNFGKIVMLDDISEDHQIHVLSECGSSAVVWGSESRSVQPGDEEYFVSDDPVSGFSVAGDYVILHTKNPKPEASITVDDWTITGTFAGCWNIAASIDEGTIKLLSNVTATFAHDTDICSTFGYGVGFDGNGRMVVEHNTTVVLDLNGYTLNKNMAGKSVGDVSGEVFFVADTGELVLRDSKTSGQVTGAYGREGGAVYVCEGGTFRFEGGMLTGNRSMSGAGGVVNHGTMYISGGRVINNQIGVWCEPGSKTYLSDKARVYDNKLGDVKRNMVVKSGSSVYVTPTLDSIARIYFTFEDEAETVVAQKDASSGRNLSDVDANAFVMDNGEHTVVVDGNNLVLGDAPENEEASFTDKNGSLVGTGSFKTVWDLAVANGGGTVRLLDDVDVALAAADSYTVDGIDMTLALNGYTLTVDKPRNSAFVVSNGGSFTIRGKNDPTDLREVVDTVGKDSDELRATFLDWNTRNASQPFGTMKYIHYIIEENGSNYELVKYTHEFSDVGKIVFSDGAQGFNVSGGSELNVWGGLLLGSSQLIDVTGNSLLTMSGGFVYGHKNTPVIIENGSSIDMRDGEFIANSSSTNGGAIWIKSGCSGNFEGGVIVGNTTTGSGGAIAGAGEVTVGSDVVISMNKASAGGAIAMTGSGKLSLSNRKFIGSQASVNGGSIWANSNVDISEVEFVGCGLVGPGIDAGGAVYVRGSGNTLNVFESRFVQCEGGNGGAIAVTTNATGIIIDTSIEKCKAGAGKSGGAIYGSGSLVETRGVDVSYCVAGVNGGGVSFDNGSGQFGGTIDNCIAGSAGGGVHIGQNARNVTVADSTISNNKAYVGGGIYVLNDMDNDMISHTVVENNVSETSAGGIGVYGLNELRILATNILGNHVDESSGYGAGIMLNRGRMIVQGCEIGTNVGFAGTVNAVANTSAVIAESDIHDNIVQLSGGGIRIYSGSVDVLSSNVRANYIAGSESGINDDFGGAGICVTSSGVLNVTNSNITNNVTTGNGGGILQDYSIVRLTDAYVARNRAENGGGVYCTTLGREVLSISDTRITNNEATDRAGGVNTREDMTLTIGGVVRITDNQSSYGESDMYLRTGVVMQIIKALSGQARIGVVTDRSPTIFAPVPFATGIEAEDALKYFYHDNIDWEKRYEDGFDLFVNESALGEITDDDNTDYDGILVQYYAKQSVPASFASNATSFELIDTRNGVLPKNSDTHRATINAYISNTTGKVVMQEQLSRIFKARVFSYDRYLQAEVLNRFMKEDGWMWSANEIWILKDGKQQSSFSRDDWNIVQWEPGKTLGELGIKDGDCIRIVSESVESSIDVDTTFYDYDITDGVWYSTKSDADNYRNAKQVSAWNKTTTSYQNTGAWGINSNANYGFDTRAEGVRLCFGNVNTGVAHRGDKFEGYYMNGANQATNNYRQCIFGLVKGIDENGHLIYADGLSVPNLFNDGDAIGKTVIGEKSLHFKRVGDTYTLTAVNGGGETILDNLDTFVHPKYGTTVYNHIYTNNFWPMDEIGVAGTDGHDFMTGSYAMTTNKRGYFSGGLVGDNYIDTRGNAKASSGTWAPSDDGIDHNNFFGMHFSVKFSMEEDYVAPLGYYFFGDDDMWVFLDDQLICDIGGVHSSAGSYTDLRDYIDEGDVGEHVLSFFYTERGASGSTCWMQFNLPHNVMAAVDDAFMFLKTNQDGEPLGNAVFGLYRDQACQDLLQTVVSDETGHVDVTDLETTRVYYLKEISAPEDHILDEDVYVVTFGEGVWSMYDISDGTKNKLSSIVNEYDPKVLPELPETGGEGTMMIYIVGAVALVTGGGVVCVFKRRRRYKSVVRL